MAPNTHHSRRLHRYEDGHIARSRLRWPNNEGQDLAGGRGWRFPTSCTCYSGRTPGAMPKRYSSEGPLLRAIEEAFDAGVRRFTQACRSLFAG
jgi:hypothetical protein